MIFQIEIVDGSAELEELNFVVAQVNKDHPASPITAEQYIQNIVNGYFQNRVLNEYKGYAGKQTVDALKTAFGDLKDIRS